MVDVATKDSRREALKARIASGRDSALARFALGRLCHESGDLVAAKAHLARALEFDPDYSAAWALLGKVYAVTGSAHEAVHSCRSGIEAAKRRGDLQAARQMHVLLKRIERDYPEATRR